MQYYYVLLVSSFDQIKISQATVKQLMIFHDFSVYHVLPQTRWALVEPPLVPIEQGSFTTRSPLQANCTIDFGGYVRFSPSSMRRNETQPQ